MTRIISAAPITSRRGGRLRSRHSIDGSPAFLARRRTRGTRRPFLKRQAVSLGQTITLEQGSKAPVTFQVGRVNGNGQTVSDDNDRSLVLVLRFGGLDAAFGVTCRIRGERPQGESAVAGGIGQVEFYMVHHYGSATSSTAR